MRAIVYHRYGGPEELEVADVEKPTIGDGQVLIRVVAASVNRSDWETLLGKPFYVRLSGVGFMRPKRGRLGSDVAGVVEQVGADVTGFSSGDEVVADTIYHGGRTFADYAVTSADGPLTAKPQSMSFEDAAAIPQSGLLALQGLSSNGGVEEGQHVLINGGGGGGGSFAIQLAKSMGAEVTAVDSFDKLEFMRQLGADHVLDHRVESYAKNRGSYHRILDFVGNRSLFAKRRALARGGVYLAAGGTMPRLIEIGIGGWVLSRMGSKSFGVLIARPDAAALERVVALVSEGTVTPAIDHVYSLEETAAALTRLGSGDALGKLVVRPGPAS